MAKARKFGTASSIVSRAEGGKLISPILGFCVHQFAEERP
jgi:endonuclease IV